MIVKPRVPATLQPTDSIDQEKPTTQAKRLIVTLKLPASFQQDNLNDFHHEERVTSGKPRKKIVTLKIPSGHLAVFHGSRPAMKGASMNPGNPQEAVQRRSSIFVSETGSPLRRSRSRRGADILEQEEDDFWGKYETQLAKITDPNFGVVAIGNGLYDGDDLLAATNDLNFGSNQMFTEDWRQTPASTISQQTLSPFVYQKPPFSHLSCRGSQTMSSRTQGGPSASQQVSHIPRHGGQTNNARTQVGSSASQPIRNVSRRGGHMISSRTHVGRLAPQPISNQMKFPFKNPPFQCFQSTQQVGGYTNNANLTFSNMSYASGPQVPAYGNSNFAAGVAIEPMSSSSHYVPQTAHACGTAPYFFNKFEEQPQFAWKGSFRNGKFTASHGMASSSNANIHHANPVLGRNSSAAVSSAVTAFILEADDANDFESREEFKDRLIVGIAQMMFVSGETAEPSTETTGIIEEIVRAQVIEMVSPHDHPCIQFPDLGNRSRFCIEIHVLILLEQLIQATALANRRGVRSISTADLIFLIRHDKAKVSRLRTFLSWKDVRKNVKDSDDKGGGDAGEVDFDEVLNHQAPYPIPHQSYTNPTAQGANLPGAGPVDSKKSSNKKAKLLLPWEVHSFYSEQVPERDDEEDNEEEEEQNEATLARLASADERTKNMTRDEYVFWSDCRQASFTFRKGKRFREWAGFGVVTDSKPNDDIVDILGFLTFEIVQTLTEEALKVKAGEDLQAAKTSSTSGGELAKKRKRELSSLFEMPEEGRTPVEPKHVREAFRRLQIVPNKYKFMRQGYAGIKTSLKLI